MLKRIIKLTAVIGCGLAALIGFFSCVEEKYEMQRPEADLVLEIGALRSRAAAGTEFTAAEKFVKSVDLFFYLDDDEDEDNTPVYYVRTGVSMNTDPATSNEGKIRLSVKPEDLFPEGVETLKVFAAVNTEVTAGKSGITLRELKDLKAESKSGWMIKNPLNEDAPFDGFEGFFMFTVNPDGDEVKLERDAAGKAKITGKVIVDKLISKIDLFLGYGPGGGSGDAFTITAKDPNGSDAEPKTWKRYNKESNATELFIVNGVNAVRLGGAFAADDSFLTDLTEEDYFDLWTKNEDPDKDYKHFAHQFKENTAEQSKAIYPYVVGAPFYTYPNSWGEGVLNTDTYLILKVNWLPDGGNVATDLLETYYKVPINKSEGLSDRNKIFSNKHYSIKVKINTLGGLHFGEPLLLDDCSYEVIPWDKMQLDAKLRETRYLEVRQDVVDRDGTHYTGIMNNTERIEIPFYSSHKVEVRWATISYFYFYTAKTEGTGDNKIVVPTVRTVKFGNESTDDSTPDTFTLSREDLDAVDTDGKPLYAGIFIDEINSRIIIQHDFHAIEKNGSHYMHIKNDRNVGNQDNRIHKDPYSPYDISIELKHKGYKDNDPDGDDFRLDKINVRQYPSRYIEITFNQGGPSERGRGDIFNTGALDRQFGHVLVNGDRTSFGNVRGMDAGWLNNSTFANRLFGINDNPMMYIVNVTTLRPEDVQEEPLHIGDPRMIYINNDLSTPPVKTGAAGGGGTPHYTYEPLTPTIQDKEASWSTQANEWKDHQSNEPKRGLTYYYPTNETPLEEYKYMLSPQFRIVSSYGNATADVGRIRARKRCASYQEDRYPAGRWRLPTPGEMLFMVRLQQEKVIPPLFESGERYWTSHGAYYLDSNTIKEQLSAGSIFDLTNTPLRENDNGEAAGGLLGGNYVVSAYTRCVYDEWYWKDKDGNPDRLEYPLPNTDVFYWGDKPKNNPQHQPDMTNEP